MSTHRLIVGSLFVSLGLIAGCKPTTPPPGPTSAPLPTENSSRQPGGKDSARAQWDLPDTDKSAAPDVKPGADALAQATQDYARTMETLIKKRAVGQPGTAAVAAPGNTQAAVGNPTDPSSVKFVDPRGARRRHDEAGANQGVAAPAAASLPGTANPPDQVASITPAAPILAPTVTQTPPRPEVAFNKDTPAVNTPLIVGQPRPLPATDDLAQRFARQVKDYPQDTSAQLDWQLLQLLQGQSVPQLQSLSTLPGEDREMLSAVLDGLTNFRNALRADNNMLLSRKIRPIIEMADRLRTQGELSIPTVALCTDVKGFGVYEPLEPARFPADGKEHRVIVYCEVENFASELDEQKRWETKLTQDVILYTEQNGLEVWRDKTPARPIVDYSRNRRHDFFIVKLVHLPPNLTIGRYLLKVSVVDQQIHRMAENEVPITIVAE